MQGERPGELAGPDVWETCRDLIPAGSVFAFLAEHRDALFPAGMFADMYPSPNGRPSVPPRVLAVTVVLQALHGLPDHDAALAALVSALVNDALGLLDQLPAQPEGPAANAAGLLALVAGQDVEPAAGSDGTDGRWRIARRTAPDRVVSVTDPDARHIHKNRSRYQDGFKAHVAFEPETGLFTAVRLTGGSGPGSHDAAAAARLLDGEQEAVTVLGDAAYGTGELRARLRDAGHAAVVKPPPVQPAVPGGFTGDDFTVDGRVGTVTCPAGHTAALGRPHAGGTRQAQFKALCAGCPLRQRCTTSKTGRVLSVRSQHALLAAARRDAADPAWKEEYRRWRPPVERAIAWLVARGGRRVPYRGITSNDAWLANRAAALNLRRLVNLGLTRTTDGTWALA
jgi:IS5 family transposase